VNFTHLPPVENEIRVPETRTRGQPWHGVDVESRNDAEDAEGPQRTQRSEEEADLVVRTGLGRRRSRCGGQRGRGGGRGSWESSPHSSPRPPPLPDMSDSASSACPLRPLRHSILPLLESRP